jgi:F-type H+-transporting ATPase subunit epsilon
MSEELALLSADAPLRAGVIRLEVVTPLGAAVRADVDQVEAPSVAGEFGVLPGHLPLLAALKAGVVRYRSAGKTSVLAVGPGFAEAGPDRVTILTDRCMDAGDVNAASIKTDAESALRKVEGFTGAADSPEAEELRRAWQWLQAQSDAAKEAGRNI